MIAETITSSLSDTFRSRCEVCDSVVEQVVSNEFVDARCPDCGASFELRALLAVLAQGFPERAPVIASQLARSLSDCRKSVVTVGGGVETLNAVLGLEPVHLGGGLDEVLVSRNGERRFAFRRDSVDLIILDHVRHLGVGLKDFGRILSDGGRLLVMRGAAWPLPETTVWPSDEDPRFRLGSDIERTARAVGLTPVFHRPGLGFPILQRYLILEFIKA